MALLRDSELSQAEGDGEQDPQLMNPLGVLRLVMAHCTNMKEKMMKQLAAAERRHRRVRAPKLSKLLSAAYLGSILGFKDKLLIQHFAAKLYIPFISFG